MALVCRRLTGLLAFMNVIAALVAGAVLGVAMPVGPVSSDVGAGYPPCSVIAWRYDGSGEPASGAGMIGDVRGALGLVSDRTGVLFVEAPVGAVADLVFDWSPLAEHGPGTQAAAWRSGVSFGIDAQMARDVWSGFRRKAVRLADGSFDVGIGRGWLVVHESELGVEHDPAVGSQTSFRSIRRFHVNCWT